MNFKTIFIATFSLFFLFTSCKSKKAMSETTTDNMEIPENNWMDTANEKLTGKTWKLIEINGNKVTSSDEKMKEAYLVFSQADQTVMGNNSCNAFNGSYVLMKGNKISINGVASTKMACRNNNIEKQLIEVLKLTDKYSVGANSLVFHAGELSSVAKFKMMN